MPAAYVYAIRHRESGRTYIGKTQSLHARWKQHRVNAVSRDEPLYRAMRKYGLDAFDFELLQECADDAEAFAAEVRLIAEHNATTEAGGYNQTAGGEGLSNCTDATRAAMSAAKIGKVQPREHVERRAESCRRNGKRAALEAGVRELHARGLNDAEIGRQLGKTSARICQVRRHLGLQPQVAKGAPLTDEERTAILDALKTESQSSVARRFGRSESLICNIAYGRR